MASASSLLSVLEEQFWCSICLDVFTEPVSTPCGHNYCKACISSHWAISGQRFCPLCNEKFPRRTKLRVNTGFRDLVENFKKTKLVDGGESSVKPGEVLCDVCPGTKLKARKSCLVCLTSYCETHLEPHQRVATLKRHKLIDPEENLENRTCKRHGKPLELFCRTDQTCICVMCTEHRHHDTVPLEDECMERKPHLGTKKTEIHETIKQRLQEIQEIKQSAGVHKKDTDKDIANCDQVFFALMACVQRHHVELLEVIREKQRATEKLAEGFIQELEEEVTELRRRTAELDHLWHSEDHLHLLQCLLSLSTSEQHTKNWSSLSEISVHSPLCSGTLRKAMAQLDKTLTKKMERIIAEVKSWDEENDKNTDTAKKQLEVNAEDLENLPDDVRLMVIQRYEVDLTLDPRTANPWLTFSNDMKWVHTGSFQWIYREFWYNRMRFTEELYVLGGRGFTSGRFYYEVAISGKTEWDLGVVRESINREEKHVPSPENGIWILRLREGNECKALDNPHVPLTVKPKKRIGVFVDYEEGVVSFYEMDDRALIYSFTGCNFTEKIYPLFSPGSPQEGKNSAPLGITPISTWAYLWSALSSTFSRPTPDEFGQPPWSRCIRRIEIRREF